MKRFFTLGFLAVAAMTALALFAFSAGDVQAGSEVREKVKLDMISTGVIPNAMAEVELELRIEQSGSGQSRIEFRVKARAEGGFTENALFSLFVGDVLIDIEDAEDGRLDLDEDLDEDDPPVTFTTLSGLMVTITDSSGMVVLHVMVP